MANKTLSSGNVIKNLVTINDKKLCERFGFEPHIGQSQVMDSFKVGSTTQDITICAGRRWGKSKLSAYFAARQLLFDNQKIWIVSLTYDMAMKIFRYLVEFIYNYDRRLMQYVSFRQPARIDIKDWHSFVECKTVDNENSLIGEGLDLAIGDEASRWKADIWDRAIAPGLMDNSGRSIVISSPFGQNWFYRRYMQTKDWVKGKSFHFRSDDNPHLDMDYFNHQREVLARSIFEQEYLAAFLSDAAAIFRNVKNCIKQYCLQEPKPGHSYIMGLDLAKFNDFSVITIIDKDTHDLVYFDRFNTIPYPLQKQRIRDVAKKYNSTIVIDALNVGAYMSDELRAEGCFVIDFKATGNSKDRDMQGTKERAVEKLGSFFESNNINIPNEPSLIEELESFSYNLSESGNLKYCAPTGLHDDCVSSLMMAVWPLEGTKRSEIRRAKSLMPNRKKPFQYF